MENHFCRALTLLDDIDNGKDLSISEHNIMPVYYQDYHSIERSESFREWLTKKCGIMYCADSMNFDKI